MSGLARAACGVLALLAPHSVLAQWEVFEDAAGSACGVVNVASLEFAVRSCDGALVLITGPDAGFENTFVAADGSVQIDGRPAGVISLERDGDGLFTLWWLSEAGLIIDFDDLTYETFETEFVPSDFISVPCQVAEFWEGDGDCNGAVSRERMQPVQPLAYDVLRDDDSDAVCGMVNAASLEFAVRACDGALVLISGPDAGFANTFVTDDGTVEIDGRPSGLLSYEQDGDGFVTLWWLSDNGFVVDFDDQTYEPFETEFLPSDYVNVSCLALGVWDGDGDCGTPAGAEIMRPADFATTDPPDDVIDGPVIGPVSPCGMSMSMFLTGLLGLTCVRLRRQV